MTTATTRKTRLRQRDLKGRSVAIQFRFLNKATPEQVSAVAAWLRGVADSIEDGDYRAKVADLYMAGYCHPLGPAGTGAK